MITTNPAIIAKLRECEAAGSEDILDAFVPMPKQLKGIITGGTTAPDGTYVRLWREGPDKECIPVTAAEEAELIANYGTASWYDWSVANWGTKWDACYTHFDLLTDGEAAVTFDTAWSPPVEWLRELVYLHPEGRTQLAYAEGGIGFYGVDVYVEGLLVKEEFSDGDFWDSEKSWDDEDVDGSMSMVTPSCRAHLEAYSLHTGG